MGIPAGANRIVYSGTLCNGLERWAFGLWYFREPPVAAFDFASGEPSTSAYVAWRTAFLNVMRPEDSFTDLDAYRYEGGAAVQHSHVTVSHPGTSSAATLPCQCAIAITLRTGLATRSGRGRIYVPYDGASVLTTTRTGDVTKINAIVDSLAAYYNATLALGGDIVPVVVSQTLTADNAITSVDADYVIDTQRRRRNQLTSSRHSAAVA